MSGLAPYIGGMMDQSLGPVGREIETRLRTALSPAQLAVINDSASHRGHMGDDGTGESHFTVEIVADAFAGQSRVQRQRLVNGAIGDLMDGTVHALAIKARAPGE
jgi:BolA protein